MKITREENGALVGRACWPGFTAVGQTAELNKFAPERQYLKATTVFLGGLKDELRKIKKEMNRSTGVETV